LVESAAEIFHATWQQPDQIAQVVRHIALSTEFANTWGEKIKRPFETIASAMRSCDLNLALNADDEESENLRWLYQMTGQLHFGWVHPNGYPDVRDIWQGSTPLVMSWRIINWLLRLNTAATQYRLDALTLTLDSFPDAADRTPNNLAQFWLEQILGYLPETAQIERVAGLLDHADAYVGSWGLDTPIDLGGDVWPHYWQNGLQTMIGLILMSPEFMQR
jgi:hypothetical protein